MCFVYWGGGDSLANQAWSGKNTILMEHEWSVRDVCFLFSPDYPEVISFYSVSSSSCFCLALRPHFISLSNYSPQEHTQNTQNWVQTEELCQVFDISLCLCWESYLYLTLAGRQGGDYCRVLRTERHRQRLSPSNGHSLLWFSIYNTIVKTN